jgi:hypothetical protein
MEGLGKMLPLDQAVDWLKDQHSELSIDDLIQKAIDEEIEIYGTVHPPLKESVKQVLDSIKEFKQAGIGIGTLSELDDLHFNLPIVEIKVPKTVLRGLQKKEISIIQLPEKPINFILKSSLEVPLAQLEKLVSKSKLTTIEDTERIHGNTRNNFEKREADLMQIISFLWECRNKEKIKHQTDLVCFLTANREMNRQEDDLKKLISKAIKSGKKG